jgi:hypothetical protein
VLAHGPEEKPGILVNPDVKAIPRGLHNAGHLSRFLQNENHETYSAVGGRVLYWSRGVATFRVTTTAVFPIISWGTDMAKSFPHIPKLDKYTSLGSYPLFYIVATAENRDPAVLCPECASTDRREAHEAGTHRAFICTADVNYEDPDLYCAECSERIESAYAEDKVPQICTETGYIDCACRDCVRSGIRRRERNRKPVTRIMTT